MAGVLDILGVNEGLNFFFGDLLQIVSSFNQIDFLSRYFVLKLVNPVRLERTTTGLKVRDSTS